MPGEQLRSTPHPPKESILSSGQSEAQPALINRKVGRPKLPEAERKRRKDERNSRYYQDNKKTILENRQDYRQETPEYNKKRKKWDENYHEKHGEKRRAQQRRHYYERKEQRSLEAE